MSIDPGASVAARFRGLKWRGDRILAATSDSTPRTFARLCPIRRRFHLLIERLCLHFEYIPFATKNRDDSNSNPPFLNFHLQRRIAFFSIDKKILKIKYTNEASYYHSLSRKEKRNVMKRYEARKLVEQFPVKLISSSNNPNKSSAEFYFVVVHNHNHRRQTLQDVYTRFTTVTGQSYRSIVSAPVHQ